MSVSTLGQARALIGTYYARLDALLASAWAGQVAMEMPTDQESETYKFLGQSPAMREWIGGRKAKSLQDEGITIVNKTFEATIGINADDWRRDKTAQTSVRVQELAGRSAEHRHKLITELLTDNPLCYDGQNFFDTDHSEGDSGTQVNALTSSHVSELNVASATALTVTEARDAILGIISHIVGINDNEGEPMNANARNFLVMCPTNLWTPLETATSLNNIGSSGEDNLLTQGGFSVSTVVNPRLDATSTSQFYVFRTDSAVRPVIFQTELDESVQMEDKTFEENRLLFGVKAIRNVGPGYWQYAYRATLS